LLTHEFVVHPSRETHKDNCPENYNDFTVDALRYICRWYIGTKHHRV